MIAAVGHSGYPHPSGYLPGCAACESACHCAPGQAACVHDGQHRVFWQPGDTYPVALPWSEVCTHMRVAGTVMGVTLTPHTTAQLVSTSGAPYSFPITTGEAGLYRSEFDGIPYSWSVAWLCDCCGRSGQVTSDWRCTLDWRAGWVCPDCVASHDWADWTLTGNTYRHR